MLAPRPALLLLLLAATAQSVQLLALPTLPALRRTGAAPASRRCAAPLLQEVASPFSEGGAATPAATGPLALTLDNVELTLDEMRPYLMADGGNVAVRSIEGGVVELELQGACGSCPSSTMTMKMGLERGLREKIAGIVDVIQIAPEGPVLDEEGVLLCHL